MTVKMAKLLSYVFTSKTSFILRWIIFYIPNKKNITTLPFIVTCIPMEDMLMKNVQFRIYEFNYFQIRFFNQPTCIIMTAISSRNRETSRERIYVKCRKLSVWNSKKLCEQISGKVRTGAGKQVEFYFLSLKIATSTVLATVF